MAEIPKVFISYSHDSPEHKQWVAALAAQLRRNGIDAILDQWELRPGDDVTLFMEHGIKDSNRVLVVCTDTYVNKANAGEGGVGYERMIVTAQLVQDLGTNKFIPIIRQASGKEKLPTCLGTRFYIDFINDSQFDEEFTKLLHELHEVPITEKPPLGKSPFAKLPSGQEAPPYEGLHTQLPEIPEQIESASDAYTAASNLARADDVLGWRQLIKRIRPNVFNSLVQWRENELNEQELNSKERLSHVVDKAVEITSPLMAMALVGIESGREQFKDQKSVLNNLLNVSGWNSVGHTAWVQIPSALGYVYQSLHGGISLSTDQIDLALNLARVKIPDKDDRKRLIDVWEVPDIIGWINSIGPDCTESWAYLANAFERWGWLSLIFEDAVEYRSSLVAYYMILNIHELATKIASGQEETLDKSYDTSSPYEFIIPITFMTESQDVFQRAQSLLLRNPDELSELWTKLNVTHDQMQNSWKRWVYLFKNWLINVYRNSAVSVNRQIYNQNILEHEVYFEML